MAAYPLPFHNLTHSSKAVPLPPCTRTMAGQVSPSLRYGIPIHPNTRVSLAKYSSF